jgi:hypothetical protein
VYLGAKAKLLIFWAEFNTAAALAQGFEHLMPIVADAGDDPHSRNYDASHRFLPALSCLYTQNQPANA